MKKLILSIVLGVMVSSSYAGFYPVVDVHCPNSSNIRGIILATSDETNKDLISVEGGVRVLIDYKICDVIFTGMRVELPDNKPETTEEA